MRYFQFLASIMFAAVGQLSAIPASAVTIYYVYADQEDTPRVITRSSDNQIVWSWVQGDPFGYVLPNQNPSGLGTFNYDLRFPGQVYDIETNTHDNVNRTYHPQLGRYIQSDPIGLNGGQWSTYPYANGNPLNVVDPSGLDWIYQQTTANIYYQPSATSGGGPPQLISSGGNGQYSGQNAGLNNPDNQNIMGTRNGNGGPLPQGIYTIGSQQDNVTSSQTTLFGSMRLSPDAGNTMYDRAGFLIHGDNRKGNRSASEGCIITNRAIRDRIGNSNDTTLRVIR